MNRLDLVLSEPQGHVVNFYDDDGDLVADVSRYLAEGMNRREAVIVVATQAHRDAIDSGLVGHGIDPDVARASGQYYCIDAAELLSVFMVGDAPDRQRFTDAVGGLIALASSNGRPVRAFGEMVALLWEAGNVWGAIELEALWNDLAQRHEFSLYCAYPLAPLSQTDDLRALTHVCEQHSEVIAPRSYRSGVRLAPEISDLRETSLAFVGVPSAIPAVRRFATGTLTAWQARELVDDAAVVVTELATNAVRHASSAFKVCVSRGEFAVRIAIEDVSVQPPERRDPSPHMIGGIGVAMVEKLCAGWGTDLSPDGKVVWAELPLSGSTTQR